MNKLSDLELEKRIADIEGIIVSESVIMLKGNPISTGRGLITDEYIVFHPLADKAMLLDLIVKHQVSIDRHLQCPSAGLVHCSLIKDNMVNNHAGSSKFIGDEQFPRAVLECIEEANNG